MSTELRRLGLNLREWREAQEPKISQEELGRMVGFKDGSSIRHFEAGRFDIRLSHKVELCTITRLPLHELATKMQLDFAAAISRLVRLDSSTRRPAA